ncbi:MAG: hypothetical protein ACHQAY_06700 [Hyphomicrobiales bacterium]
MKRGKLEGRGVGHRQVGAGLLTAGLIGTSRLGGTRLVLAEAKQLNILVHRVMQLALTQGPAGELTTPWRSTAKVRPMLPT